MAKSRTSYKAGPKDNCGTPAYAVEPLLPYIPEGATIWEPAAGEGRIVKALLDSGRNLVVQHSDIQTGVDFLTAPNSTFDIIITNPPYSSPMKGKFIKRCFDLGKPFALLVQVDTLGTKSFQRAAQGRKFEILLLSERIDFYMPFNGYTKGGSPFACMWLCSGLLPEKVVFGKVNKPEGM